jgi:hypothetical protein
VGVKTEANRATTPSSVQVAGALQLLKPVVCTTSVFHVETCKWLDRASKPTSARVIDTFFEILFHAGAVVPGGSRSRGGNASSSFTGTASLISHCLSRANGTLADLGVSIRMPVSEF